MPEIREEVTIYRCLRSSRKVKGPSYLSNGKDHDECADIIARNPQLSFEPGLSGVEADHMAYKHTNWEADRKGWPEKYLIGSKGRLGNILVSFRLRLIQSAEIESVLWRLKDPQFYLDPHLQAFGNECYQVGNSAVIRVRIEEVVTPRSV